MKGTEEKVTRLAPSIAADLLEHLINGESAPSLDSPEFPAVIAAIASLGPDDFHAIGTRATLILLDRLSAGMNAERTLKIMRGGPNPLLPN